MRRPVTRVRPGHADLAGALKYGFNDVRDVLERASARETTARVAAGGVARAYLRALGIETWSFTAEVGGVAVDPARATRSRDEADASPLRCPDPEAETAMIARIDEARSAGDTVGGVFEVVVHGLPIGLGSYVHWDRRLDAALAAAVMSINIVKGVEIGLGFEQTRRFGSAVHDVIEGRDAGGHWIHRSNNAGGLTGGVTNGEPLVVRGAVKPISTLARPLPSADLITGEAVDKAHYERSDISVVPAAGVVGEAMVMLVLAAVVAEKFGGDTMDDVRANLATYRARIAAAPEAPVAGGTRADRGDGIRGTRPWAGRHRRGRLRRRRLGRAMDVVLIGLPGSGKSVVGKRLAHRHGAEFIDLDERIERADGRPIPTIFAEDGEATFRTLEREAVADLGPADDGARGPTGDRHGWRRGRRPAQPMGAVSRPDDGLARRPARDPGPAPASIAARSTAGPGPRPDRRDAGPRGAARAVLCGGPHPVGWGRRGQPGRRARRGTAGDHASRWSGRPGRAGDHHPARCVDADRAHLARRRHRGRGRPPGAPSARGHAGHRRLRARGVGGRRRSVRRRARDAGLAGRADRAPAGRGGQAARRHRDGGRGAGRRPASSATSRSSRSVAAPWGTRPASSPRPICGASR